MSTLVIPFSELSATDIARVGGKNASLGEMIRHLTQVGVKVPDGFATTAEAFKLFLDDNKLAEKIKERIHGLDVDDVAALAVCGRDIRAWILEAPLSADLETAIRTSYQELGKGSDVPVAVRSSATAEDLPEASFAGQQETFLNICGINDILSSVKHVFASLYNDRAIAYRVHHNFPHEDVLISCGIQRMVRADSACSGVLFTIDTESGFDQVIFVTAAYGLGELVVQGAINPDEFYLFKPNLYNNKPAVLRRNIGQKQQKMMFGKSANQPVITVAVEPADQQKFCITDEELEFLGRQALLIEKHYGRPMDIEWAKDGVDQQIYILQARPETVHSRESSAQSMERYILNKKGQVLVEGRSIGQRIGKGPVVVIKSIQQMDQVKAGDVLVTDMTDPDWEPIMKRASAIVTNRGGRTCHAAIIARELGIPAIVGCGIATEKLKTGDEVTVSCAEGDVGYVYSGLLDFEIKSINLEAMPAAPLKVMMNVGNPDRAFQFQKIPNEGVGLARLEFIISQMIGVHPRACLEVDNLPKHAQKEVMARAQAYKSPREYYIAKLTEGIATLAAAFASKPVIIRMSDFKSNEYANLLGGDMFEPHEENPMLGFRGAARYVSESFCESFKLECEAIKRVRNQMGFTNVQVMIPFVRSVQEAKEVIAIMASVGLERGKDGLKLIMMCELPTNALLAGEYLEHFDGFSIGSNDLTQLTLGLDRDSGIVSAQFDERDPAVKMLISMAIKACRERGKYIGICGQGPSDHPDFAQWLVTQGIESVSLNPDTVLATWMYLAAQKTTAQ
ncbi:MAG: phosphoenolpyruvate synthase [Pseudomonadota bacterium]